MKKLVFIGFTLLCSIVYSQAQDDVNDIFHFAGNLYINGNNKGAKAEIDRGLSMYPEDQKLLALKEKIKEEEKQQQQQQQDQEQQDNEDQEKKEGEKNDEQQNNDQKNQQEQQQDGQKGKNEEQQNEEQKEVPVGEISKEDAERLLKALEEEEKSVLQKLEKEKAKGKKVPAEKEW